MTLSADQGEHRYIRTAAAAAAAAAAAYLYHIIRPAVQQHERIRDCWMLELYTSIPGTRYIIRTAAWCCSV